MATPWYVKHLPGCWCVNCPIDKRIQFPPLNVPIRRCDMSGWNESPTGTKPFIAMSDKELKDACYVRILRQNGTRAEILARLDRHVARGGGVSSTRLREIK